MFRFLSLVARKLVMTGKLVVPLLCLACLAIGAVYIPRLFNPVSDISERVALYFEEMRQAGKLVVLTARQRFNLSREYSGKILALIDIRSRIELSVMADLAYYIEVSDPSVIHASWNRKTGVFSLSLPAPQLLPPAILTETIEINTTGATIFSEYLFRLRQAARNMQAELSSGLAKQANASLESPELLGKVTESISGIVQVWLSSHFHIQAKEVKVAFQTPVTESGVTRLDFDQINLHD